MVGATVFLKSLTLKGFKSFADATTMTLEPGVTVVVGPNGSGKSNIVDAVAWVLGAQAPRSVRSQKMDDVIFAGTEKRPALGRAEVSLTLDNTAGLLPIEFNEVTLTRILFRSGDSEYAINGVPCRLLDLQELLSDAGVGRQQHVIVSQGQIDAVLNARPEERRAIIEEAAGVLKYRKRKEKAERRLDATEANLLRLQDLLREVRRQLRPLERQAEAARRHEELVHELGQLRVFVAGREITSLRRKLESIAVDRIEASAGGGRAQVGRSPGSTPRSCRSRRSCPRAARATSAIGSCTSNSSGSGPAAWPGILAERKRSLERDHGQLLDAGVVANLEADAARLRDELDEVDAALDRVAPESEALTAEEEAFADGAGAVRRVVLGLRRRRRPRPPPRPPRCAASCARSATRSSAARASCAGSRRAATRCAAASTNSSPRPTGCAPTAPAPSRSRRRSSPRSSRRRPIAALAEVTLERATHARHDASEAASRAHARVEALQLALDAAHARAGAERLAGVDGVLGTLLDLVEIDDGWEHGGRGRARRGARRRSSSTATPRRAGRSPRCASRTRAAPCWRPAARGIAPHAAAGRLAGTSPRPVRPARACRACSTR